MFIQLGEKQPKERKQMKMLEKEDNWTAVYLFNKHLSDICGVPGTSLINSDTKMNQTQSLDSRDSQEEKWHINR